MGEDEEGLPGGKKKDGSKVAVNASLESLWYVPKPALEFNTVFFSYCMYQVPY
jgi:hypothetical protein